jgi:hypothetical protein
MTADNSVQEPLTGIDRALLGTPPWDASRVTSAIKARAANPGAFTIEQALEMAGIEVDPDHANSIGALTAAAAKQGVIVGVSYTKARRQSRAAGVVRVWVGTAYVGGVR